MLLYSHDLSFHSSEQVMYFVFTSSILLLTLHIFNAVEVTEAIEQVWPMIMCSWSSGHFHCPYLWAHFMLLGVGWFVCLLVFEEGAGTE